MFDPLIPCTMRKRINNLYTVSRLDKTVGYCSDMFIIKLKCVSELQLLIYGSCLSLLVAGLFILF